MEDFFLDKFLPFVLAILLVGVVCLVIFMVASIPLTFYSLYEGCQNLMVLMPDREIVWNFWNGCLIKAPSGYFVDASDYLKLIEVVK